MIRDICICCGRCVNGNYRFCIDCESGRVKMHDDCIATGMSEESAKAYVESIFPCRYSVPDSYLIYAGKLSRAGYKFNGKSWVRYG